MAPVDLNPNAKFDWSTSAVLQQCCSVLVWPHGWMSGVGPDSWVREAKPQNRNVPALQLRLVLGVDPLPHTE